VAEDYGCGFISVPAVSRILAIKASTVRRWIYAGRLPALRVGHGRGVYRVAIEDIGHFFRRVGGDRVGRRAWANWGRP